MAAQVVSRLPFQLRLLPSVGVQRVVQRHQAKTVPRSVPIMFKIDKQRTERARGVVKHRSVLAALQAESYLLRVTDQDALFHPLPVQTEDEQEAVVTGCGACELDFHGRFMPFYMVIT